MSDTSKISLDKNPTRWNVKIKAYFDVIKKFESSFGINPFLWVGSVVCLLIMFGFFPHFHHDHVQKKAVHSEIMRTAAASNPGYVGKALNDISVKLAMIEQQMSVRHEAVNLDPIRSEITALNQQVQTVADHSQGLIGTQIRASTALLESKLIVITEKLQKLQDEKKRAIYLNEKNLPFKILHIDNIQEQNVVTVSYDHQLIPLTAGDYLTGWKLISADFSGQRVEFVNSHQQHVLESLNRIHVK